MRSFIFVFFLLLFTTTAFSQEKVRIALLDFDNTGGLSLPESVTLANRLSTMLVKTEAFIVLERGKMQGILEEQGFQQTGCTSSECAIEAGKLLNVQKMISGSIGRLGQTYTVDISLIDVETAQIEKTFFEDYKGEIDGLLEMMEGIAIQIANTGAQKQPQVIEEKKTYVLKIDSDPAGAQIVINGRSIGKTPYSGKVTENLKLNISLQMENYEDWQRMLTMSKDWEIDADLKQVVKKPRDVAKKEPKTEKEGGSTWYYWLAGGAAVAGGVAYFVLAGDSGKDEKNIFPKPPGRPGN